MPNSLGMLCGISNQFLFEPISWIDIRVILIGSVSLDCGLAILPPNAQSAEVIEGSGIEPLERYLGPFVVFPQRRTNMSVEGKIKEGAGYIKEEMNEHKNDPKSQKKAQEGRDLRNEGRVEDGKAPKTTPPGTGH
jgi:hypothetical protein